MAPLPTALPQVFEDDVLEDLNLARKTIMSEIQPQHYRNASELSQLLTSKAGLWKRLDPHMELEIKRLGAVGECKGVERVRQLVLDQLPT